PGFRDNYELKLYIISNFLFDFCIEHPYHAAWEIPFHLLRAASLWADAADANKGRNESAMLLRDPTLPIEDFAQSLIRRLGA
ncbi:MAG: hypothetical protein B6I38_00005, partial [Anaerolineaceae bacterium 4572_5.1]